MRRLLAPMVLAASLVVTAAVPTPALATSAKWTSLSVGVVNPLEEPTLVRAADGKLHGAWVIENSPNDWSIASVVLSPAGKVLTRGWVVQHWYLLQLTPKITPYAGGWAVVFNGSMGVADSNAYSKNTRYWATSTDGNTWTLQVGSLSSGTLGTLGIAATTETDGTLVTMESFNNALQYRVGADAASPATTPDGVIPAPTGAAMLNPQLVRAADGSIWAGWYQQFGTQQGYWAQQILPTVGTPMQAPGSYNANQFNLPVQQVAMVARAGGGVYMAYCEVTATLNCAKVGLWRVGAAKALTVPGSVYSLGRVYAKRIALSAGPGGRLEIAFYNEQANNMYLVWTNHKVSAFSGARTFNPVKKNADVENLFIDGTKGPVDVVTNTQLPTSGAPSVIYHTQLLPALKITASAHSFSHKVAVKLTFKVTDVGDPVPGVKVTFDGKSSRTNAKGVAVIKLSKGAPKGKHAAVARVTNWQAASVAITTT